MSDDDPRWHIRPRVPADDARIRVVNAANVPAVGPLDDDRLALFSGSSDRFDVVEYRGRVEGMFVGLVEGTEYTSPNYRWFDRRHDRFAYVDRIALQPVLRGLGVADELYRAFEERARASGRTVVCAEVNTVPPNPRSLGFHRRRGYEVVGEQAPYGTDERVAMVEKRI